MNLTDHQPVYDSCYLRLPALLLLLDDLPLSFGSFNVIIIKRKLIAHIVCTDIFRPPEIVV